MSLPFSSLLLSLPVLVLLTGHCAAEPLRLITIGDSITRGVRPDVKPEETFAALVRKALVEKGMPTEVTNAGIGGDTVDALKSLQAGVIAKKPHLVTIMYGTNDSYVAKGKTEGRNSLSKYEAALRAMITGLKQEGIQVIVMTSPPWAEGAPPDGLNQHPNIRLAPYVEVCRAVAKELQVPLVDHYAHWTAAAEKGGRLKDWTSDFCHPNPRGHQELAKEILRILLPLAQEKK
jgi:lysophospholipase L1-like esterase